MLIVMVAPVFVGLKKDGDATAGTMKQLILAQLIVATVRYKVLKSVMMRMLKMTMDVTRIALKLSLDGPAQASPHFVIASPFQSSTKQSSTQVEKKE